MGSPVLIRDHLKHSGRERTPKDARRVTLRRLSKPTDNASSKGNFDIDDIDSSQRPQLKLVGPVGRRSLSGPKNVSLFRSVIDRTLLASTQTR